MTKLYIVGNPNSGKTTLFNAITKSSEHVGNWHGVTVDKTSKCIQFNNNQYEIIDLPGLYSFNAYSLEEQVAIDEIQSNQCENVFYLLDVNNFRRGMLLLLKLLMIGKNVKVLLNNYDKFKSRGGQIDVEYLHKILGCEVQIINAKNPKIDKDFFNFKTRQTAFITTLKNTANKPEDSDKRILLDIQMLYQYIFKISNTCLTSPQSIYGYSKLDDKLLKLSIYLPAFIVAMFGVIYITFFVCGPIISNCLFNVLEFSIKTPVMAIVKLSTHSPFVIALFEEGIFSGCFTILGFLPQISLLYLFLTILENSGIITRLAFLLDDFLTPLGLNGKMVYTMLMGLGCSTSATITTQNMPNKNSKIKASLLIPFISCSAKLPIYTTVAGALFGVNSIWVILGLYLLGIIIAIILSIVYEHTIFKGKGGDLLIEFPPLKSIDLKIVLSSVKTSCKQFLRKVFGIIFGASILIWLLSSINLQFKYVSSPEQSLIYSFSCIISWILKPIGLNNPNIVCALLVGLVAKEMILSTMAITNKVSNLVQLGASLTLLSSPIHFNIANGISFLVFVLLYLPCVANFGVMLKQVGVKMTMFSVAVQLIIAYMVSYICYIIINQGISYALLILLVIALILISIKIIYSKIKSKKIFNNCMLCNRCKK